MDHLGTLTLGLSVIDLEALFGRSSHRAGPLDYAEWNNCVRLGKDKRFHGVWDIPLTRYEDWDSHTNELIGGQNDNPPVLPPQDADSVRLTIHEERQDGLIPSNTKDASGFTALRSQWRKNDHDTWYHIDTYETSSPARVQRYIRLFEDENMKRQGREYLTQLEAFLTHLILQSK